jgi:hypothetical protein
MISGVIVLSLFITALVAMVIVNQEYDSYQGTVDTVKQAELDSFSENLRVVPPGLVKGSATSCGDGTCTSYTLMIASLVSFRSALYVSSFAEVRQPRGGPARGHPVVSGQHHLTQG